MAFYLVLAISRGLNIGIWRKFEKKTIHCNQNRAMQTQRWTKALLFVSAVTLSSWMPTVVYNLIILFWMQHIWQHFLLNLFLFLSSWFINPNIGMHLNSWNLGCPITRLKVIGREGNVKRVNMELTFEQEIVTMEDTRLWSTEETPV